MITRPHDAGRRPRRLAVLEEVKSFLSDFPNGLLLNDDMIDFINKDAYPRLTPGLRL